MGSGLPTAQIQSVTNYLNWDVGSVGSTDSSKMLTPFPTLHKLRQLNGAAINIELSKQSSTFAVDSAAYIDTQYPIDTEEPTKTVEVTTEYDTVENQVIVWAIIVWCVVITLSLVGIVVSIMGINGAQDKMSASIAYETLKDKQTDGDEHAL
jgi:hypothetical protein